MLRIVMDSAGDMPDGWREAYDVQVIPVNLIFNEDSYLDGVDLSKDDFYRLIEETGTIPTTSQPSAFQCAAFYRQISEPGDEVLSIHVSSKLSGTHESAVIAARELEGERKVIPFDSAGGSASMGLLCREARQLARAGKSLDDILERLAFIRGNASIVLTLDTLKFARMSGRIKTLQAALASLLDIKPIVEVQDGMMVMANRVRTRGRAISRVLDTVRTRLGGQLANVVVVHAQDIETGQALLVRVKKALNCQEAFLTELSTSVAVHLGPGTVGIVAYPVE